LDVEFNSCLQAHNVFEIDLDSELLDEARALYETQIKVHSHRVEHGGALDSAGGLSFFVVDPPNWGSNIRWYSSNNRRTHDQLVRLFERLQVAEHFRHLVDFESELSVYCCFFVTRSQCRSPYYHSDYYRGSGSNAFTLMVALHDGSEFGQSKPRLLYRDVHGRERCYEYQLDRALVFGELFEHATAQCEVEVPDVFLCFTFGTDKHRYWPRIWPCVRADSRLVCTPWDMLVETRDVRINASAGDA
jgi:hypothetical protein